MEKTLLTDTRILSPVLCGMAVVLTIGCSSLKNPATTEIALTNAAIESAAVSGGSQFAPMEMNSARAKLVLARQALDAKKNQLAIDFSDQSQADAKLAQSKANTSKARAEADLLADDLKVLREEISRHQP